MTSSTPPFCPRVADLWAAVQRQGGAWTTHRVLAAHRRHGHAAPKKATARRDLELLARAGLVVRRSDDPDRRFYTLAKQVVKA